MKKGKMKVVKNCGGKKRGGCQVSTWESMIGKTFEKKAA